MERNEVECNLSEPQADFDRVVVRDIYKEQDELEVTLKNIDDIVEEAKETDAEFYNELKNIFSV